MAIQTSDEKWREIIIPGLIPIDAFLAQQQRHDIGMAIPAAMKSGVVPSFAA